MKKIWKFLKISQMKKIFKKLIWSDLILDFQINYWKWSWLYWWFDFIQIFIRTFPLEFWSGSASNYFDSSDKINFWVICPNNCCENAFICKRLQYTRCDVLVRSRIFLDTLWNFHKWKYFHNFFVTFLNSQHIIARTRSYYSAISWKNVSAFKWKLFS